MITTATTTITTFEACSITGTSATSLFGSPMKNQKRNTPIPRLAEYLRWYNQTEQKMVRFYQSCKARTPIKLS